MGNIWLWMLTMLALYGVWMFADICAEYKICPRHVLIMEISFAVWWLAINTWADVLAK